MQRYERNFLTLLKYRVIDQTVESWLQAVIQRLEDHRTRLVNECSQKMPHYLTLAQTVARPPTRSFASAAVIFLPEWFGSSG
jgi:hypothetical protein